MFRRYALWNWNMSELDVFLLQALASAAQCLDYATRTLPADKLAVVDFARLTGAPVATLDGVNFRLRLCDWENAKAAILKAAGGKVGYRADTYHEQQLPPMANAVLDQLHAAQLSALASHGV